MKAINKIKLVIVGMIIIGLAVLCPFTSYASEVASIEIIDFGLYLGLASEGFTPSPGSLCIEPLYLPNRAMG